MAQSKYFDKSPLHYIELLKGYSSKWHKLPTKSEHARMCHDKYVIVSTTRIQLWSDAKASIMASISSEIIEKVEIFTDHVDRTNVSWGEDGGCQRIFRGLLLLGVKPKSDDPWLSKHDDWNK